MANTVVRTRIMPPPKNNRILARPRILQVLDQAMEYRLTILQAEAGYGKSTALADYAEKEVNLSWYQLNQEDNDSMVFLLHLCHALLQVNPGLLGLPIKFLDDWDGSQGPLPWKDVVDQLINVLSEDLQFPLLLVMDDAHLVTDNGDVPLILDRLVGLAPRNLHVLLSGRPVISLPSLSRWRSQGEVLFLDQSLLTFTKDEIETLYSMHYGLELSAQEVNALGMVTEGWAIALQLIWQNIRSHPGTGFDLKMEVPLGSLDLLFDMLTHEVFEHQPADVREFLTITATLRELKPTNCDLLRKAAGSKTNDSASMLAYLRRQDLFIVESAGESLRFHHIFHNFLRQQAADAQRQKWNQLAADIFLKSGEMEEALYHLVDAGNWEKVADLLDSHYSTLLSSGRLDTLASFLDKLPPEILVLHPSLTFSLGELARLHSRFDEALGWYEQARRTWKERGQQDGIARALRGQARIYLDTVDPSKAGDLLEEAIRLTDGFKDRESQVRLFELLAENKLNAGHVEEAENFRQKVEDLRLEGPENDQLLFRVMLRTGRIMEARRGLEKRAEAEKLEPVQTPRAHRETLLILSLIYAFLGLEDLSYQVALEGTKRGNELKSPFVTAVGYMRQGHALTLRGPGLPGSGDYQLAREQFMNSIEISKTLDVPRLLVEADWGLCRVHGYQGNIAEAQVFAQEAIEIASQAGDEWIASLTRLTMGASLTLAERFESAQEWLNRAILGFKECSDPFGTVSSQLWLSLVYFRQKNFAGLDHLLPDVLACCKDHDYGFLFERSTLLGAPDPRIFVPLLIFGRKSGWNSSYANQLLENLGIKNVAIHPGYKLSIETLGSFRVWRGSQPIPSNGWQREKSRQLFQLFLTSPKIPLDRDQVCESLWPGSDPQSSQQNFKIALNTLYHVLEPDRQPGSESAYILREGSSYILRPNADIWLDAMEFKEFIRKAANKDVNFLEKAVDLYKGPFLPDSLYEDWAAGEREHLAALFLEAADNLVEIYIELKEYSSAIDLCTRILNQDNCWERAYRYLMIAYEELGDHGQVGRTFQRCSQILESELNVTPAKETIDLFQLLTA